MNEDILEKLAKAEHDQWCDWAGVISKELYSLVEIIEKSDEDLSDEDKEFVLSIKDRLTRWDKYMVDYSELSEEDKEKDRVYARKIISLFNEE
jgi:hypothetical protein